MTHIIDKIRERRRREAAARTRLRQIRRRPEDVVAPSAASTTTTTTVADTATDNPAPPSSSSLLYYSFEFFPPKTEAGVHNLQARIERMVQAWDPLFVSVTFAPHSYHTSLELATHAQRYLGIDVCLHVTCQGMNALEMKLVLNQAKHAGIHNLLVLRGDPPPGQSRWKRGQHVVPTTTSDDEEEYFPRAIDLVKWIKWNYGDWFGLAVAGHPEGQCVDSEHDGIVVASPDGNGGSSKPPSSSSGDAAESTGLDDEEIRHLKDKIDAGVDLIITQFFYDPTVFQAFVKRCRHAGIHCPILPGILPVQSYMTLRKMTQYCGVHVPDDLLEQIQSVQSNDERVKDIGCQQAIDMCRTILETCGGGSSGDNKCAEDEFASSIDRGVGADEDDVPEVPEHDNVDLDVDSMWDGGVDGLHFYTLNLERSVTRVLTDLTTDQEEDEGQGSVEPVPSVPAPAVDSTKVTPASTGGVGAGPLPHHQQRQRQLPWRPSALTNRSQEQVRPINWANRPRSYVMRTDDWDEFPNGRWGDSSSPAFGELSDIGHYYSPVVVYSSSGGGINGGSGGDLDDDTNLNDNDPRKAMLGGYPQTPNDIYEVFARYVEGKVPYLPWCESSLQAESFLIQHQLAKLNRDGFLTINSQPSVNGAPSHHKTFGWGQPNGYVYQKAYCECFCSPLHLQRLLNVVRKHPSMVLYAINHADAKAMTQRNREARRTSSSLSHPSKAMKIPDSVVMGNGTSVVDIGSVTALTWGVFPNQEVVQPTIFDPRTFLCVWAEEAFGLWDAWTTLYDVGTVSYNLLTTMRDTYYLCAIVDNDYVTTTTSVTTTASSEGSASSVAANSAAAPATTTTATTTSNHLWDAMLLGSS